MLVNPVTFPSGRAKLAMSPAPTASATPAKTKGIVPVACLAAKDAGVAGATITSGLRRTNSVEVRSRYLTACKSIFDGDVLPLDVPELTQPLLESIEFGEGPEDP